MLAKMWRSSETGLLAQTSELIEYLPGIAKTAFGNRLCYA